MVCGTENILYDSDAENFHLLLIANQNQFKELVLSFKPMECLGLSCPRRDCLSPYEYVWIVKS